MRDKNSSSIVIINFLNQAQTEKNVGRHSKTKSQRPWQNGCKKQCLKGGDSYYLVEEKIVGSYFSWLYGGKHCEEKHVVGLGYREFNQEKGRKNQCRFWRAKNLFENLTLCKISDTLCSIQFKKARKKRYVVFKEWNKTLQDFSNGIIFSKYDMSRNFQFKI